MQHPEKKGENVGANQAPGPSNRGVALILVLGLLAVLLMAGVAFSISMRTERLGAGSSRFSASARHLVWAGLCRALKDIEASLTATNGKGVYPDWTVFASEDFADTCPDNSPVKVVFSEQTLQEVPRGLWSAIQESNASWVTCGSAGGPEQIQGRFAYVAVNISGYLDANKVAGTQRWVGVGAGEIVLTNTLLPEIRDTDRFVQCRNDDYRYETIWDFYQMQIGEGVSDQPAHFVTYSRFPGGSLVISNGMPTVITPVDISGDVTALESNRIAIISALIRSGIPANHAPFVFSNLLDYVDQDNVPRHLNSACTESVPMLNEVVPGNVRLRYDNAGNGSVAMQVPLIRVEWLYPFVAPSSKHPFEIGITVESQLACYTSGVMARVVGATNLWKRDSGYKGETNYYGEVAFPGTPQLNLSPVPSNASIEASIRVRSAVYCVPDTGLGPNMMVDAAPFPTNATPLTWKFTRAVTQLPVGEWTPVRYASWEALDPRANWDCSGTGIGQYCWRVTTDSASNTLGRINSQTEQVINMGEMNPGLGIDSDTLMYVSDRGHLLSPGELGNLLRQSVPPAPLCTIRLFRHGTPPGPVAAYHNVLAYFTVIPPHEVRRGLVNPNTHEPRVLASAFVEMPLGYPESSERMSATDALALGNAIVAARAGGLVFTNVADLGALDFRAIMENRSDLERESVLAYSCGLLSTRQHLFVIYVVAGPYSPSIGKLGAMGILGGEWHSYQRAVATVWRDPFPDKNGVHACFVRSFRWLGSSD